MATLLTSNWLCGLKETTRIFYFILSHFPTQSVLWHKSIYFVYSHVTTIANITCSVTCKNAVSNAATAGVFLKVVKE